jgi:hypothetical protein
MNLTSSSFSLLAMAVLLVSLVDGHAHARGASCRQFLHMNMTDENLSPAVRTVTDAEAFCALCTAKTGCVAAVFEQPTWQCRLKNFETPLVPAVGYMVLKPNVPCSALSDNEEACVMTKGCSFCEGVSSGSACYNTSHESCCGYAGGCGPVFCNTSHSLCCLAGSGQCLSAPQCCVNGTETCCVGYEVSACMRTGEQCCNGGQVCDATAACCSNTSPSSPYSICCDAGTTCCSSPALEPQCCRPDQACNDEEGCVDA